MQGKRRSQQISRTELIISTLILLLSLFFSQEDSYIIFRDAAVLNMTESGYVWIVTEQSLSANNTPDGVLGLRLLYANFEKEHLKVNQIIIYYYYYDYLYI